MRRVEDGKVRKGQGHSIGVIGTIVLISIVVLLIAAFMSGFFENMVPDALDKALGPFLERIEAIQ